ncbi:MAG: hypothetical protein O7I42_03820, partial [Alphaproteobacteria bacterium]|nr:hypothetical protein [Alphaproteobacteria bacterium]
SSRNHGLSAVYGHLCDPRDDRIGLENFMNAIVALAGIVRAAPSFNAPSETFRKMLARLGHTFVLGFVVGVDNVSVE